MQSSPIGIFDSGYGGLTVFRAIKDLLPQYDYIYLGDNARAPYGPRSFETIREYTWECVQWLFAQGCPLVILACNTASAKALRSIQQEELPQAFPDNRVLGVIRPTAEVLPQISNTGHIGILGTKGTVQSGSYILEMEKQHVGVIVHQHACPLLVPIIEAGEAGTEGADFFVKKYVHALLEQSVDIDTVLLACTHYPLLKHSFRRHLPPHIKLVSQGNIVANSLQDYLLRHPEMEARISKQGSNSFFTTDDAADFNQHAGAFFGAAVSAQQVHF